MQLRSGVLRQHCCCVGRLAMDQTSLHAVHWRQAAARWRWMSSWQWQAASCQRVRCGTHHLREAGLHAVRTTGKGGDCTDRISQ